jgi:hypothetical protein
MMTTLDTPCGSNVCWWPERIVAPEAFAATFIASNNSSPLFNASKSALKNSAIMWRPRKVYEEYCWDSAITSATFSG